MEKVKAEGGEEEFLRVFPEVEGKMGTGVGSLLTCVQSPCHPCVFGEQPQIPLHCPGDWDQPQDMWQPTPVFCLGNYMTEEPCRLQSVGVAKELDLTEQSDTHRHTTTTNPQPCPISRVKTEGKSPRWWFLTLPSLEGLPLKGQQTSHCGKLGP